MKKNFLLFFMLLIVSSSISGQTIKWINSEADVPKYSVPELLKCSDGRMIKNSAEWKKIRRPEILALLEKEEYGAIPGELKISEAKVLDTDLNALGGKAIRKQVKLTFQKNGLELSTELLMYLPKGKKSFPTFIGYNFLGNQTIGKDPAIHESMTRNGPAKERGLDMPNWPLEQIIQSGCGVATMYIWDIAPDKNDFSVGIYPLLYTSGQVKPTADQWGAISAWAWGLSRALDYLQTDKDVDGKRVIVFGHSRMGKTALWAGASDQRFAGVISNNSGCCGAALSKRVFGETVGIVNTRFPHWLCGNYKKYSDKEESMTFDQHELLALVAPRPLYVASASEDLWADPKGEYLSACYATPVWKLYGFKTELNPEKIPQPENPISGIISHHIRIGIHDLLAYDWQLYINFAKKFTK